MENLKIIKNELNFIFDKKDNLIAILDENWLKCNIILWLPDEVLYHFLTSKSAENISFIKNYIKDILKKFNIYWF